MTDKHIHTADSSEILHTQSVFAAGTFVREKLTFLLHQSFVRSFVIVG
jgi:hypothetical protein